MASAYANSLVAQPFGIIKIRVYASFLPMSVFLRAASPVMSPNCAVTTVVILDCSMGHF